MELKQCLLTKNDCYKKGQKITPKGIVVHSTGANNPNLRRYVQPDDGILGKNTNNNHWNKSGVEKCVHAFIGKDKEGNVRVYQTLPFNYACWGVGKGKKGSYNYNPAYIQFEICEDNLKDEAYFNKAFNLAIEFCAYLCKEYNLSVDNVVSHQEAYKRGYGSNHGDCDHWLKAFGKNMDWFRDEIKSLSEEPKEIKIKYVYNCDSLNVRKGAGTKYAVVREITSGTQVNVYETKDGWSRIGVNEWVSSSYLSDKKPTSYPTKEVYNCNSLNVRNKPSTLGKKIATLKKGDKVKVYATNGSWSKIAKESEKWCSSKYLK